MEKVNKSESQALVEAVLLWTGWGRGVMPCRDDSALVNRFGSRAATELLSVIKSLQDDFYTSDAKHVATDLTEMERMATEDFSKRHPDVADDIVKALAWCYTFDFK